MKSMKSIIIILLSCTWAAFLGACEKIEVLPPPDDSGGIEKTGTGNSDARSILFVMNDTSTLFVNTASTETHLVTKDVTQYLANDQFARPLDPSNPDALALDIFPTLKSNDFLEVQPAVGNLEPTTHVGAFGVTISEDWHVHSNWWVLDPQSIDYGYNPDNVTVIEGRISSDQTWTSEHKYLLKGQVFVEEGVTLTIEPGTIIFGKEDVGINSGVLCFNRGARINANGTPDKPIIFTGTLPPGQRTRGQWGGILFLGRAPNNKGTDVLVEGIQGPGPDDGLYGGDDPEDNSGSFSYARVEYAGIAVSPGNELNSITFGSVGSATEVHHIIVVGAGDDSMEWFGGSVDVSYVGINNTLDDDMDMDAGFSGNVQYVYIVRNPYAADESGSACFEVSSSKSQGIDPQTIAKVSNVTVVGTLYQLSEIDVIGDPKYQGGMFSKEDAAVYMINSVIIGAPTGIQNP